MRVLIAFDKFRGSLTAREACATAVHTLGALHPDWELDACPLTDGGEGFADILTRAASGSIDEIRVSGPRGGPVLAPVGMVPAGGIPKAALSLLDLPDGVSGTAPVAVVDMAAASGLSLIPPGLRDPWRASSRGTGELMMAAARRGAAAIVLGVGGSGTHDLGLGALGALGLGFLGPEGRPMADPVPENWPGLSGFAGDVSIPMPPVRIACDVSNPLLGERGAAAVFAPQKGLLPADLRRLESETKRIAGMLCGHCGAPTGRADEPGSGAAGGLAFGLMIAARARLLPGFPLVSAWLGLDARLAASDLVLTGEGRFDAGSLGGKGPGALAARAAALGTPVHIFAGEVEDGVRLYSVPHAAGGTLYNLTPASLHAITPAGSAPEQALREAAENLAAAIRRVLS